MTNPPVLKVLTRDPPFRPEDQSQIALFVAQLDDQSRRLAVVAEGLSADDLAWQPRPGRNSAGMLLAHNAVTEVFWAGVATGRVPDRASSDPYCLEILGLDMSADGMPAKPDGGHPESLAGWELPRYLDLLARARRHLRTEAAAWRDADLAAIQRYASVREDGSPFRGEYSREWILYHLLEHYAQHAGQVSLLVALRRPAAGV